MTKNSIYVDPTSLHNSPFHFLFLHTAIVQDRAFGVEEYTVRNKFHWQRAPPAQQLLLRLYFKGHCWKLCAYQTYLPATPFP